MTAAEMVVDNSEPCMKNIDVNYDKPTATLQTTEAFARRHYSVVAAYRML